MKKLDIYTENKILTLILIVSWVLPIIAQTFKAMSNLSDPYLTDTFISSFAFPY